MVDMKAVLRIAHSNHKIRETVIWKLRLNTNFQMFQFEQLFFNSNNCVSIQIVLSPSLHVSWLNIVYFFGKMLLIFDVSDWNTSVCYYNFFCENIFLLFLHKATILTQERNNFNMKWYRPSWWINEWMFIILFST